MEYGLSDGVNDRGGLFDVANFRSFRHTTGSF